MQKVSTLEVRQRLGDILNRVALRHDEFIVERKGKPLAAMVPVGRIKHMREFARLFALEFLRRPRRPLTQAQADRLANEAKHWSRHPRLKRQHKS